MRANLREIAQQAGSDPKRALWDIVGDAVEGIDVCPYTVLIATYIPPEKTKGGIILADRTLSENRWQGKVGLLLKLGDFCFEDDTKAKWGRFRPQVNDWIICRFSDAWEVFHGNGRDGTSCRYIHERDVVARTKNPDFIF